MSKLKLVALSFFGIVSLITFAQNKKTSAKLDRADCFFGVHFDLHASEDITDAGRTLSAEMIDTFLTRVRPDFIQIDCKGHPGISSYPTKVGYYVKGFDKDPLRLFREVTEKNNVALFMHFSGVWDSKVVKEHPDWAMIKPNGDKSAEKVSFFSPYLDRYMIPQLKELSDYGVDGAWIDGECWAVEPDYGEESVKQFTKETGITDIPKKPSDKYYPEFMEYTRKLFRAHLKKYIDAIHQYDPGFQITSNWSYSSLMPERVTTDVDYLSGDVTPLNGVYRSAFEARCLAPQGKPWDLMAWGFSWNGGEMPMNVKSSIQLEQEAAQIMAMGGGVQFYFQQNNDLSLKPWLATTLSEIGIFCRDRQEYCHKAKAIPQIALLYPTASYQKSAPRPFSYPTEKLQGALNIILDGQFPAEVLMEHHLTGKMDQYPLIVIPECDYLEASFLEELKKYVRDGGRLLIIGTETVKLFEKEIGVKALGKAEEKQAFISASDKLGTVRTQIVPVELMENTKTLSVFYNSCDFRDIGSETASSINKVGKGSIAAVYFNAGSAYLKYKSPVLRDYFANHINELFHDQIVRVSGSHLVHVAVNTLNSKMYVNLINIAGEHTNQSAIGYDEIPSLKNLHIKINTTGKPARILLQPGGQELRFDYYNGISEVTVPELAIHSILEVIL